MDIDSLIQQLGSINQATSSQTAALPQTESNARQALFGGNDATTNSLQGNEDAKISELYQHDKMLSQVYAPQAPTGNAPAGSNVPGQTVGGGPTYPTTQGPSTTQTVAGATGLQGLDPNLIQNPYSNIMFGGSQSEDALKELVDITNNIKNRHDALGNALDQAVESAKTGILANKQKADAVQQQIQDLLEEQKNSNAKATSKEGLKLTYSPMLREDLGKGMTLNDALNTYGDVLDPTDIYNTYNQVNNESNKKGYGPAKENPLDLASRGIKVSEADKARFVKRQDENTSIINGIDTINGMYDKWKNMSATEKYAPDWLIKEAPGIAPTRNALNTTFYDDLAGVLRKAVVGGRITQTEIGWIKAATMPTDRDTIQSAEAKRQAAVESLKAKIEDPNYTISTAKLNARIKAIESGATNSTTSSVGKYKIIQVK